jgi:Zn-dependent protease
MIWFTEFKDHPVLLVSWIVWVIVSIVLHELAHGWVAIRCGDDVPIHTGHMTWNPLVHIPFPWAWVMFALFGFTWGLMPTNPDNYRGRWDDAKVSFAGPAMNLILAAVCLVMSAAWSHLYGKVPDPLHLNIHTFLWAGIMINLVGFLFNLIPVPPLDGWHIAKTFIPALRRLEHTQAAGVAMLIGFVVLMNVGSALVWRVAMRTALTAQVEATVLTGGTLRNPYDGTVIQKGSP